MPSGESKSYEIFSHATKIISKNLVIHILHKLSQCLEKMARADLYIIQFNLVSIYRGTKLN